MMLPVVILAGGLATRLRPLTTHIPKALIEINYEPFIAHQLRLLKAQGISEVVLCLGYLGEMVQDYLGDGSNFGIKLQYSFDGEILLGTAGSIKKALAYLPDNFFVMYGDSYLPCDFDSIQAHFLASRKQALMTVFQNEGQWDKSNVEFVDGEIIKYDKVDITPAMKYIDYGLGVFSQAAFDWVPEGSIFDLAALYQQLLAQDQLASFEVQERFYEIGSHSGIQEFSEYLLP